MRVNATRAAVAALTVAALTSCAELRRELAAAGLSCAGARAVVEQVCSSNLDEERARLGIADTQETKP